MKSIQIITVIFFFIASITGRTTADATLPSLIQQDKPAVATVLAYYSNLIKPEEATGFFVANDKLVTNFHAVANAERVEVITANGRRLTVKYLLAGDERHDCVLLELEKGILGLRPLSLDVRVPAVGTPVYLIAAPVDAELAVSTGCVSSVTTLSGFGRLLHHSAPTYPGSSGSPVMNFQGKVIAIHSSQIGENHTLNNAFPSYWINLLLTRGDKPHVFSEWTKTVKANWLAPYLKALDRSGLHGLASSNSDSVPFLKEDVRLHPTNPIAWYSLAYCQTEAGDTSDAIASYRSAIQYKPDFALAYRDLGLSYIYQKNYSEATTALEKSVQLDPKDALAHTHLAEAYNSSTPPQPDKAVSECLAALNINPKIGLARTTLGQLYMSQKHLFAATLEYKQALLLNQNDTEAYAGLGQVYLMRGNLEDGISNLHQVVIINSEANTRPWVFISLGNAYVQAASQYADMSSAEKRDLLLQGINAYKHAISAEPKNTKAHCDLGLAYVALSKVDAKPHLKEAQEQAHILVALDKDLWQQLNNQIIVAQSLPTSGVAQP